MGQREDRTSFYRFENGAFILSENLDLGIEIRAYDLATGRIKRHANRSFPSFNQ